MIFYVHLTQIWVKTVESILKFQSYLHLTRYCTYVIYIADVL